MAVIGGIQKYSITSSILNRGESTVVPKPVVLQHFFYLINPSRNYAAYREQFDAQPGVPFLPPHIEDAKGKTEGKQKVLHELLQKVYSTSRS